LGASIVIRDRNSGKLNRVACAGRLGHIYAKVPLPDEPGQEETLGAEVMRTGEPCFIADAVADARTGEWKSVLIAHDVTAGALLPLFKGGRLVGFTSFFFD